MNIMGIGVQEMIIVLVGALLIFGPDRLPEVAGQMGKFLRDMRKMTGDLTGELERTAGVGDIKKAVQSELMGVKSTVDSAAKGAQSTMKGAAGSVSSSVSSAASAAKGTTAKPTTGTSSATTGAKTTAKLVTSTPAKSATAVASKPVASKRSPRADVSFFEGAVNQKKQVAVESNGSPAPVAAPAGNGVVKTATSVASPDQLDALARARQRRMTAGYNRQTS